MVPTTIAAVQDGAGTPLVTVVLTVFKRTRYLEEAVSSVLRQTMTSLELIVTDDADTEETRTICRKFRADVRVKYRTNGSTPSAPLNIAAAIREARGKYLTILNDDDLLELDMLERLVAPLEDDPSLVLAFCNYKVIDQDGRDLSELTSEHMRMRRRNNLPAGIVDRPFDFTLRHGLMVVMGCVFRRQACNADWLVPEVAGAYDYWLAVNLANTGGGFYFIPEMLMRYRAHQDSESAKIVPEKHGCEVFIYESLSKLTLSNQARNFISNELALYLYRLGRDRLLHGEGASAARQAIAKSLGIKLRAFGVAAWAISFLPARGRSVAIRFWLRGRQKHANGAKVVRP